ncbi:MAG: molecular chaperone TorD family protein [Burkholderiales bacterium]|nr:molecular chaperone TorD family protein [Burkholderiales bacterium]
MPTASGWAPRADAPAAVVAADLFAVLAAAFAAPPADLTTAQWCAPLAADLEDMGPPLGLDVGAAVAALRDAAADAAAGEPWLVAYSRLFLVPPVRVTLNTGVYLEGTLGGTSAQMISGCYAAAGYAPCASFHDLPDHVAMQLEFVAALLRRGADGDAAAADAAREFVEAFVAHWTGPLRHACERRTRTDGAARVYAALADVLAQAVDRSVR